VTIHYAGYRVYEADQCEQRPLTKVYSCTSEQRITLHLKPCGM